MYPTESPADPCLFPVSIFENEEGKLEEILRTSSNQASAHKEASHVGVESPKSIEISRLENSTARSEMAEVEEHIASETETNVLVNIEDDSREEVIQGLSDTEIDTVNRNQIDIAKEPFSEEEHSRSIVRDFISLTEVCICGPVQCE